MFDIREAREAVGRKVEIRTRKRLQAIARDLNEERERRLMGLSLEDRARELRQELNYRILVDDRISIESIRRLLKETEDALRQKAERKRGRSILGQLSYALGLCR